jgi:ABC-type nickel/cobalt efflux system permease component RcnA
LLGVTGGIIPCWDAIALLFITMGTKQFWLALPALLAFSAGLAGVLILIGILVVKVRAFAGSKWGGGRLVRALPIVSAVFVTAIGFWLCYASVSGAAPP